MRQRKTAAAALILMLFVTLLTGCRTGQRDVLGGEAIRAVPVSAKEFQPTSPGDAAAATAARGANAFALRLSAALAARAGDGNFVCSPYSVWMPLAALVNATDAKNEPDLLAALGAAGISEADLNRAASRMLYDLTNQEDKEIAAEYGEEYYNDPLKIANAVFVGGDVTLKKGFAQTFMDFYRGSVIQVNFRSPQAVEAVNRWASDNTEGMIPQIVQGFDESTVAAIANAIYFSDRWSWEFDPAQTREDVFHSPAGDTKARYMLREGDTLPYYEDDQVQAMPLDFKTGGGMYIILPKNGDATGLLSAMAEQSLDKILAGQTQATGKLLLPRFSIEGETLELKDTLAALGVPLFDAADPALTGGLIEENIPVWLSSALHKAVIKVDEKGTTAAAVTVMVAAGAAMPRPTEPFEMVCNKPFIFVLFDRTYDGGLQILFTGVVNQP